MGFIHRVSLCAVLSSFNSQILLKYMFLPLFGEDYRPFPSSPTVLVSGLQQEESNFFLCLRLAQKSMTLRRAISRVNIHLAFTTAVLFLTTVPGALLVSSNKCFCHIFRNLPAGDRGPLSPPVTSKLLTLSSQFKTLCH